MASPGLACPCAAGAEPVARRSNIGPDTKLIEALRFNCRRQRPGKDTPPLLRRRRLRSVLSSCEFVKS